MHCKTLIVFIYIALYGVGISMAQTETKLIPTEPLEDNEYYGAVSISNEYAALGASGSYGRDNPGAVFVFQKEDMNWTSSLRLTASDGEADDQFGAAISLSGNAILIGAPNDDDQGQDAGAAYVFRHDGTEWVEEIKLGFQASENNNFGTAVSLSGEYAVVGVPGDRTCCFSGSAYVYRRDSTQWIQEFKIIPSDGASSNVAEFGRAVVTDGEYALISANRYNEDGQLGVVYVFRREGVKWVEEEKITLPGSRSFTEFGRSISLSGDYALIGAPTDNLDGTYSGSAFIFRREGSIWLEEAVLTAYDVDEFARFGSSVSLSGDFALVGTPSDDDLDINTGATYVFRRDGDAWAQVAKVYASDTQKGHYFGNSLFLQDKTALIGSSRAGAYAYDISIFDTNAAPQAQSIDVFVEPGATTSFELPGSDTDGDPLTYFITQQSQEGTLAINGSLASYTASDEFPGYDEFKYTAMDGLSNSNLATITLRRSLAQFETKLVDPVGTEEGFLGNAVSMNDDYAVVGAYRYDDHGENSGSVFVYRREGVNWVQEAKLSASDASAFGQFGSDVDIDGEYILVGASTTDEFAGAAYVFHREGENWVEEAKLTASDAAREDFFGGSVALEGNYALIGATSHGDSGGNLGAAYLFRREGKSWIQEEILTPDDAVEYDGFGRAVSLSGEYALVGAPSHGESGSVYVFRRHESGWAQEAKLTASDSTPYESFGFVVSLSGDVALIGSPWQDDVNEDSNSAGAAYIFRREGENWSEQSKLIPKDRRGGAVFGRFVALQKGYALIGAPADNDKGSRSGSAYVFRFDGVNWVQELKLTASDGASNDLFGADTAMSGSNFIVGASGTDNNGESTGAAYIFDLSELTSVSVEAEPGLITPAPSRLAPNYPNPFASSTTLGYTLEEALHVRLEIIDLTGRHITTLIDAFQSAGSYTLQLDAASLSSGVYVYQLRTDDTVERRLLTVVR